VSGIVIQDHVGKDGTRSALIVDTSRTEELGGPVILAAVPEAQVLGLYDAIGKWLYVEVVVQEVGNVRLVRNALGLWGVLVSNPYGICAPCRYETSERVAREEFHQRTRGTP
jgi:hypothetical protein